MAWGERATGRPQQHNEIDLPGSATRSAAFAQQMADTQCADSATEAVLYIAGAGRAGVAQVWCEGSTQAALRGKKVETHADLLATRTHRDRRRQIWSGSGLDANHAHRAHRCQPGSSRSEALRKIEHAPSVGVRVPKCSCDSGWSGTHHVGPARYICGTSTIPAPASHTSRRPISTVDYRLIHRGRSYLLRRARTTLASRPNSRYCECYHYSHPWTAPGVRTQF